MITTLIGGPADGMTLELQATPMHLRFETQLEIQEPDRDNVMVTVVSAYARLDNPDTGEYLGGYLIQGADE